MARKFFDDDFSYLPATFMPRNFHGLSNISENDNEYTIEVSAPGFKKEDIKIELENDVLKISSEIENKKEEKNEGYSRKEFYKSSFSRHFTIPNAVKKDGISASMKDGILMVTIPKNKTEKKSENLKISIK
jgi:HSP20 family protein